MFKTLVVTLLSLVSLSAYADLNDQVVRCGNDANCLRGILYGSCGVSPVRKRIVRFYAQGYCYGTTVVTIQFSGDLDNDVAQCKKLSHWTEVGLRVGSSSIEGNCETRPNTWSSTALEGNNIEYCESLIQ